jgi:hypothetical protein
MSCADTRRPCDVSRCCITDPSRSVAHATEPCACGTCSVGGCYVSSPGMREVCVLLMYAVIKSSAGAMTALAEYVAIMSSSPPVALIGESSSGISTLASVYRFSADISTRYIRSRLTARSSRLGGWIRQYAYGTLRQGNQPPLATLSIPAQINYIHISDTAPRCSTATPLWYARYS